MTYLALINNLIQTFYRFLFRNNIILSKDIKFLLKIFLFYFKNHFA